MSGHYYTNKPSSKTEKQQKQVTLRGEHFTFTTDHGVFSKKDVDFGTKLLIESFQLPTVNGKLLDVGCGYGPIGLSLAKATSRHVDMVDLNERALELAKENAVQNNINNVNVFLSNVYENITGKYAAILSNPPIRAGKKVVHQILEEATNHLVTGGQLWIVIQKKQGAPSALAKMEEVFENVEVVTKKKGYFIIRVIK